MDNAQHCINQSSECRHLAQLAQSEANAYAPKLLARSWLGLAAQIDRYHAMMREQRSGPKVKAALVAAPTLIQVKA
jgi:hypothetical protein